MSDRYLNICSPERVVISVVGRLELDVHKVDGGSRRTDKEHLHRRVIQRDKV